MLDIFEPYLVGSQAKNLTSNLKTRKGPKRPTERHLWMWRESVV